MRRVVLFLFLFLFLMAGVLIAGEPEAGIGSEDVEKIEGAVDKLPFDETGEINFGKYSPFITKAEERVAKINLWLEDNGSWLKIVFGMVPSLTWFFAVNLYIWLFLLVFLFINADSTFSWVPFFSEEKMDFMFFQLTWARISGLISFGVIVVLKATVGLANIIVGLYDIFWNYVFPAGLAIAVIFAVLFWGSFLVSIPIVMRVVAAIKLKIDKRRKEREADKESLNRQALDTLVQGALGPSTD
jgi:hypothetical protein